MKNNEFLEVPIKNSI